MVKISDIIFFFFFLDMRGERKKKRALNYYATNLVEEI